MAQTMCGIEFLGYAMSVAIVRNLCYYFLIPELWPGENSVSGCTTGPVRYARSTADWSGTTRIVRVQDLAILKLFDDSRS